MKNIKIKLTDIILIIIGMITIIIAILIIFGKINITPAIRSLFNIFDFSK